MNIGTGYDNKVYLKNGSEEEHSRILGQCALIFTDEGAPHCHAATRARAVHANMHARLHGPERLL